MKRASTARTAHNAHHWPVKLMFTTVALSGVASADIVTDWTATTTTAVVAGGPRASAVDFAIVHAAMYDAVNAIDRRHEVFKIDPVAPTFGASQEAAAATAAYKTLEGLFPSQSSTFDAAYATSIATVPDSVGKARGIAVGEEVAQRMLELRAADGRAFPVAPYVFGFGAGVYQQTPAPYPPTGPVATWLPSVSPFVLLSPSQFRAYGPPGLTSARYTRDVAETRGYGSIDSAVRTEAQSEIARFHTENPNQFWGRNLGNLVAGRNLGSANSARVMALLAFALADAGIACFDSKYTYNFWRPVTAIRQADTDANPQTASDPAWAAFVPTPPHPEYPAAHGCAAGAVTQVLNEYFRTPRLHFQFNSVVTNTTHEYKSTNDLVEEIIAARVYGGMHFRNSGEQGVDLGKKVAKWIGANALQCRHAASGTGCTRGVVPQHNSSGNWSAPASAPR
jgi:PAP2 superfamily